MLYELNKIYQGDCLEVLQSFPDNFIDCCVTSPPYFGLRDYGHEGQIGMEATPELFIESLVKVFNEVKRVLKPAGTLFLNLGDSYFSNSKRANSYGTSDKAPVDYPKNDCLCESLCDGCRKAYQIGKSHKDSLRDPKQSSLPSLPIREHKEFENGHFPTLDSSRQVDHTLNAIRGSANLPNREDEQPLSFHSSTPFESSLQPKEHSRQSGNFSSCLLCGGSFENSTLSFADKSACTCDIQGLGHPLNQSKSGIFYSHKAYNKDTNIKPQCTYKSKDLIGIPWLAAFALRSAGWYLRQDIIWQKPSCMPESVTDRCTKNHEYIFLMSKSSKYYFDNISIQEDAVWDVDGNGTLKRKQRQNDENKNHPTQKVNGMRKVYENVKTGTAIKSVNGKRKRNKRSVWTVNPAKFLESHFATFPEELIVDCIKAGCPENGIVLDPFNGAGTTSLVASKLNRNYIGIELNQSYIDIANKRLQKELGMFNKAV